MTLNSEMNVGQVLRQIRLLGKRIELQNEREYPVIAVDGTAASGKGVIAAMIAKELRWGLLDSGLLYRAVAYTVQKMGILMDDVDGILSCAVNPQFVLCSEFPWVAPKVFYRGENVTFSLRSEAIGMIASEIAVVPELRKALLPMQRDCRKPKGLVADGRDMGTVVFPDAKLKIFLDASMDVRVRRRLHSIADQGENTDSFSVANAMISRDSRDRFRRISPMVPADDAICLDTTNDQPMTSLWRIARQTNVA